MNHLTNIWRKFKASAKHGGTEVTQAKKTAGKQTLAEAHAEALEEMEQLKVHIAELEAAHEAAAEAAEPLTWGDLIQHTIALLNTMPEDQRHQAQGQGRARPQVETREGHCQHPRHRPDGHRGLGIVLHQWSA